MTFIATRPLIRGWRRVGSTCWSCKATAHCELQLSLRFDAAAVEISAALRRASFLASHIGQNATVFVQNEPWCSWRLPELTDGPHRFQLVVYFDGERLAQVRMVDARAEFGTSWSDWTEAKEQARKVSHDEWLRAHWARIGPFHGVRSNQYSMQKPVMP